MSPRSGLWELVGVAIASFVAGYTVHYVQGSTECKSPKSTRTLQHDLVEHNEEDGDESEEEYESESDVDIDSSALNSVPGEVRMTLVVRQDLKMTKGKAAAQCSHATLALYKKMTDPSSAAYNPEMVRRWEYGNGQAKITLQVPNQEGMDMLFAQAMSLGINAYIVHDAGRTQIAAGSATVLGLGPAPKAVMDEITQALKLY